MMDYLDWLIAAGFDGQPQEFGYDDQFVPSRPIVDFPLLAPECRHLYPVDAKPTKTRHGSNAGQERAF